MIRLIVIVAVMVAGLIFGPEASGNKGYVLISLGNYTVESSVTSAVILAVLFYGALLIVEWVLARLFGLRRKTQGWFGSRRRRARARAGRFRQHRDRRRRPGRAQGLDDHPGRRQGRYPDSALLLPRQAFDRRQLPHVPGGRGEIPQARTCLCDAGDGRDEGLHPVQACA